MILAFCFPIGVIAGLRAMTAPAAVAWTTHLGWPLNGTPLAFLGRVAAPWVPTAFAVGELISDPLPKTPSRKVPIQFGTRIVAGALAGAALGTPAAMLVVGTVVGAIGAVAGTLGGAGARGRLAGAFGRDLPAALLEDAVAIGGVCRIVGSAR